MKRYGQYCPVAHALDQIGDRWALLIVRELMLGQRRFTDLSEALPGIGSNILTARLRSLDTAGIVRRTKLPPPLGVTVYELTPDGRALEPVLVSLAQWGAQTLGAPNAGDCWSMYAVHARFRPETAVDGVYEIDFGEGEVMSMTVEHGELSAGKYAAPSPTLAIALDPSALHALIERETTVAASVAAGDVRIVAGSETELEQLVGMFARPEATASTDLAA